MDAVTEEELYESLQSLMARPANELDLLVVVMALTGTVVEDGVPKLDPDMQAAARRVVLRWMRDRAYVPATGARFVPRPRITKDWLGDWGG